MLYFVVRALDTAQFGQYQFVLTCVALATVCALPGLNNSLMQSIARGFLGAFRPAVRLAFRASFVGSAVLLLLALWYSRGPAGELPRAFVVAAALFPFAHGLEQWKSLRTGVEDFSGFFRMEGMTAVALGAAMIAAVLTWPGAIVVPLAVLLGVQAVANGYQTVRALRRIPRDARFESGVLGHGARTTVYSGLNTLANQIDKILLFAFLSPASLAVFVAAERIPEMTKNAVQDVAAVLAPRFAKRARYDHALDRSLRVLGMATGATIVVAAFTVLPWLVTIVFGEAYRSAIPYAQALMCTVAIGNVSTLRYRYVTSQLDESGPLTVNVVMSATRIAASAILVPWLGLVGAVVSTAIYRLVMVAVVDFVIRRRYLRPNGEAVAR
jgi:O-antigen/teichoic acid export membrane protein